MRDYVICIDASVDIDQNFIDENHVVIIPMKYVDILYISLSGGLSSTYSSAQTAAEEVMEEFDGLSIEVVDSRAATGGMGLLLLEAVRAKQKCPC